MIRIVIFSSLLLLQVGSKERWEETRKDAEMHHDVVMQLIEDSDFKQAVAEAKKIFQLPFPKEKQALLVEVAREVSDALFHHKQHGPAQDLLDEALKAVSPPQMKAEIYKMKAYLYTKMGDEEEAKNCFKKALELERR